MKYKSLILLSMLVPTVCFGEDTNTPQDKLDFLLQQNLPLFEERIQQMNPELVQQMAGHSDTEKLIQYNNYMARVVFQEYKEDALRQLHEKSASSHREILSEDYDTEKIYWLKDKKMDSRKCLGSRANLAKIIMDSKHACEYPDGFEEFSLVVQDENEDYTGHGSAEHFGLHDIDMNVDDKATNTRTEYNIKLVTESENYADTDDKENIGRLSVDVTVFKYNYDEYHAWRNQNLADTKQGKYRFTNDRAPGSIVSGMLDARLWHTTPQESSKCEGLHCYNIELKNPEKWKSTHLPEVHVESVRTTVSYDEKTY